MRDIIIFAIVGVALLKVFSRPYIGIYLWTWLSLMNPHRLTWGAAYNFPFAAVVAGVTLISILIAKQPKRMIWTRESVLLLLFVLWMILTTFFAFNTSNAVEYLDRVLKIEVFVFLTIFLITDRQKLHGLIWVTALSLGFYGVKGGIFTLLGGGVSHVLGPDDSFIGENNALALALIMTVPLISYLFFQEKRRWLRYGLGGAMFLCGIAIFGSQSRGALLGVIAMATYLWFKSRRKGMVGAILIVVGVTVLLLMPDAWWERMGTIGGYQQDESAQGRVNAWWTAWNVAKQNLFGGGFKMFSRETFLIYAPDPNVVFDAHSIYFQVLGEHGFIGLGLFLLIALLTWMRCGEIIRMCKGDLERRWAADLAGMLQVSMIGFAVSGAFLSLAYFDYYYHLIAITLITWSLAREGVSRKQPRRGVTRNATPSTPPT